MDYHIDFEIQGQAVDPFEPVTGNQTLRWFELSLVMNCNQSTGCIAPLISPRLRVRDNTGYSAQLKMGISLNVQPVDVDTLLQSILATHTQHAAQKGLRIELVTVTHSGLVQGDQLLLHRALDHIIENTIHFTVSGGNVVSDTGPGIPPDEHEQLFSRLPEVRSGAVQANRARAWDCQSRTETSSKI